MSALLTATRLNVAALHPCPMYWLVFPVSQSAKLVVRHLQLVFSFVAQRVVLQLYLLTVCVLTRNRLAALLGNPSRWLKWSESRYCEGLLQLCMALMPWQE